ncbi:Dynamin-related protein 5A [Platanthera zijinensis]|uniref:Dynamin-related protein 5A n=1 Tax=Platanthera zijinensis TaxID=2320716 RepID=A0AAP0BII7_9ASPA
MAVRRATHQTHTAGTDSFAPTPPAAAADFKSRFEAYNRLQAAAFAFGEKLPIPEIVAVGGQSDGKSSLLEALLGFRFNVREVEMGTRRPLLLQMVHDPSSLEPRCRFQDEDSEDYGSPVVFGTAIADLIRSRTDAHLKKIKAAVSSKPIVMRAEYAHCPNLTIIDTPGFVLKAKKGEPENTPDEILSMVKSLATPPHRLLLFLQQSSVEWCSSLWLDSIKEIDPTFKRTIIVVSKFDNRLKEFSEGWEVDRYLSASGYLGENTRPFFVALPKDRGMVTNEDFRRQISQVDVDILHHLRENVKGGFNEEKFEPFIGFGCLRKFLECELQKRYKDAAPATLALLEQRCGEISEELGRIEHKLQATSDVSHLRKSAMLHAASICTHVGSLIDGAADPAPEQWGKTTIEEQEESGFGSWPGVATAIKPANSDLRLYGGAAFERVMYEFRCATYSIECPPVSREKVANILLAHAGRGGGGGLVEAAAEIARAAARAWLAPILETACERLAFVLKSLFDLAVERNHSHDSDFWQIKGDMDGYVGFHASLRRSYNSFVNDLSKHCKQLVHHHLDSVTSPYSQVCYDSDFHGSNSYSRCNQIQSISYFLDMSESTRAREDMDQENIPPKDQENTTPGKKPEPGKVYRESQMTIPETPSPDLPSEAILGVRKKDNVNCMDIAGRKRQARSVAGGGGISDAARSHNPHFSFGDMGKSGSSYVDICSLAAQHFARIREVLVERSASSALNSGFLTPCRERLMVALGLELFAVTDEKFMDMFVAPGAIDALLSEQQSLQKREKILQSCLIEFKNIARAL